MGAGYSAAGRLCLWGVLKGRGSGLPGPGVCKASLEQGRGQHNLGTLIVQPPGAHCALQACLFSTCHLLLTRLVVAPLA